MSQFLLSILIIIPVAGAMLVLLVPRSRYGLIKWLALATTLIALAQQHARILDSLKTACKRRCFYLAC